MCSQVDDKVVDLSQFSLEGIAVLNIPSMYGGSNLWGADDPKATRKRAWSASKAASVDAAGIAPLLGDGEFHPQGKEGWSGP